LYTSGLKMLKKDARILWNVNDEGKVTDILVTEFSNEINPQQLYQIYKKDIGNCNSNWDKITLVEALIIFGFEYEAQNKKIKLKILQELIKIDEWKEEIKNCTRAYLDQLVGIDD